MIRKSIIFPPRFSESFIGIAGNYRYVSEVRELANYLGKNTKQSFGTFGQLWQNVFMDREPLGSGFGIDFFPAAK